jgi:hypothetical protein
MSMQHITSLVDSGKTVSFYLAPENIKNKGKYICEVSIKDDGHIIFAETIESLLTKLERKNVQNDL